MYSVFVFLTMPLYAPARLCITFRASNAVWQAFFRGTGQQLFPHTGCRTDLEGTVRQVKAHQLSIGINIDIVVGDRRPVLIAQRLQQRLQFVLVQGVPVGIEKQVVVSQKRVSGVQLLQFDAKWLNKAGGREGLDRKSVV